MEALIVLLISLLVVGVSSNPTGPPAGACTTLTPGHPASMNNKDTVPYQITVDSNMYAPGADITVTIEQTSESNEFKGFIIQARRKTNDMDEAIGTFKDPPTDTQLLQACSPADSTWAHSAASLKTTVTAKWTGPPSDEGTLAFRATIVVTNSGGNSTFYENIMSEDLTYNPAATMASMTTDDDGGAGLIRASLILTIVTLLIVEMVTRKE